MRRARSTDPQDALNEAAALLETGKKKVSTDSGKAHAYAHLAEVYIRLANAQEAVNARKSSNSPKAR